ncbi:MAG: MbnP family protein [Saprospiraceae bacterium]
MKFNQLAIFAALFIGILFIASCTPDEQKSETGTVTLEFEHVFDSEAFTLGEEYTTSNGDVITANLFKYYVSNVVLSNEDGSTTYTVPNSYYIVDASNTESLNIDIQDVPNGEYSKVNFILGVDAQSNTEGAQEGALAPEKGMYWSWNTGYIFLKLEGTTSNATDITYHIGGFSSATNNNIKTIERDVPTGSMINVNGSESTVHYMVDVAEFFKNPVDFDVEATPTVTMPNANSVIISENYEDMHMINHVHNE